MWAFDCRPAKAGFLVPVLLCCVQAISESFFELASVLWTTAIAMFLYMSVFQRKTAQQVEATFKWLCLFCWGIPFILTLIPGAAGMYGGAGAWCWIKPGHVEWRFIQFYIPLWLAISFNSVVYIMVIRVIKNMAKASNSETARDMLQAINRLRWYPIILLIVGVVAPLPWVVVLVLSRLICCTSLWACLRCGGLLPSTASTKASRKATCSGLPFCKRCFPRCKGC